MSTGRFVVFEGIDGSGKTGALAAVAHALRAAGVALIETREPGGTEEGLAVRRLLVSGDALDWSPMGELLLVNAARVEHAARVIRPALAAGRLVLCDRFLGSTLAYQGGGRGLPAETILALHRLATGDLRPDLTLVLDVAPPVALARSRARLTRSGSDETRFEALDLAFHERVRQSFLDQAAACPAAHRVIDASGPVAAVADAAFAALRGFLAGP